MKRHPILFLRQLGLSALALGLGFSIGRAETPRLSESNFTSARKCGECHQDIYQQWSQSMHSRSFTDPIYRAVVDKMIEKSGGKNKAFCLSCHAPVASVSGTTLDASVPIDWNAFSAIAAEGVTCDFCHTMSGNENRGKNISVSAYVYPRRGLTEVKYGRHPDANNREHMTEVSSFLTSAEVCAVCHQFKHPAMLRETQNTYREWLEGPYSERGTRCQDCHMPAYSGVTAKDGKPREKIHAHVFAGGRTEMLRRAATLTVWGTVDKREGGASRLKVNANIRNAGAGHTIPTGVPGVREIWLEVLVKGTGNDVLDRKQFRLGQWFVKKNGDEALPWEEYESVVDRRIAPEQSRLETFELDLPARVADAVLIEANLKMQLVSEVLSRQLGVPMQEPLLMTSAETTVSLK